MNSSSPLVSFVVPCYNYARYLSDCLNSIFHLRGNYDIEVIAIDDCSQDNTFEILNSFADPRLRVVKHSVNKGHVFTVNEGFELTRGRYVARIDPDDRYRPDFLAATIPILEAFPEIGAVYTDVALIDESGVVNSEDCDTAHNHIDFKGSEFVNLLARNFICAPTLLARREAWMSAWPIPEGLAFNDWYFNIMLSRRYPFYYLARPLADYRVHSVNHHSKIVLNGTDEASVLWLLNKVYGESEADSSVQTAKQRLRNSVYGNQYLTLAEKYFGAHMDADARRCYWRAVRLQPRFLVQPGVARRFAATLSNRRLYEYGKRWLHGRSSTK